MSLESATQAIRSKVGDDSGLEASLKFYLGADGVILIDGKSTPNTVNNTDTDTDCTVGITLDNLQAMLDGNMGVAMRLQNLM
jgi:putative sterol carrier protein